MRRELTRAIHGSRNVSADLNIALPKGTSKEILTAKKDAIWLSQQGLSGLSNLPAVSFRDFESLPFHLDAALKDLGVPEKFIETYVARIHFLNRTKVE